MAKKEDKTNAMRILDAAGIVYTVHSYETEDGKIDGVSVALKCGEDPDTVFKTLVTAGDDRNFYVFVIPVKDELDLKACARSVSVKSIEMIHMKDLLGITGYIHGGCSPIGMKKKFKTVYDETIELFDTVLVSGGRVGLQVELNPRELLQITERSTAALTRN
ncbi:MAG: Cys-tRNA(Pro) deacylase [Erysipelotrichia bacterium]|nr:Cys-tRNA(Pro) deacylase [Erysipelotrichia bacterium]